MEVEIVSSDGRSNRSTKDRYNKVHSSLLKKRVRHGINESLYGINKAMSHLIPKGRHFDDVNLLEFTVEYLKQTTDFQRGVGLCAEETKSFLKNHVFDRSKISALFQEIEQRIDYISKQQYLEKYSVDTTQRQNAFDSNHTQADESGIGVLLDLSMKQNRLREEASYSHNANTVHSFCSNLKKREILDKIRKKILDKRRLNDTSQKLKLVQNEMMWRPWRY